MKRYRFVVLISLLLAVALMACQSEEVVETATPVPPTPTPTITPQALQQLGVSEVVVDSLEELNPGQEIVLVDISALVTGNTEEFSEYAITSKISSISDVDPMVIQLPLQPEGGNVDFNIEGENDPGLQVYALKVQDALVEVAPLSGEYTNLNMPPLAGLSLQFDLENYANIESGWMLAWAADNQQMFPSGSGEDDVLFTDDDPLQPLELGYTAMLYEDGIVVRFREASTRAVFSTNQTPLTFDLSAMDAADAYDEAVTVLESYYPAWNDEKSSVMKEVKSSYSDEEQQLSAMVAAVEDDLVKYEPQEGGYLWLKSLYPADYGIEIHINEENEIRAYSIRLNGPAEEAGLEYGDEILKVNGIPVLDAIDAVEIPFISTSSEKLQQKLKAFYLFRGQEGQEMKLEIKTLIGEDKTISMEAEINSFWLLDGLDEIVGYEYSASLPVEHDNEGDYGYIRINDFDKDPQLTRSMFLDALENIEEKELDYLLLDYRQANGAKFLELAGYFMDQDTPLGSLNCLDSLLQPVVVHSAEKNFPFKAIGVITGEACSGTCEIEVLAMQQMDNVTVYGLNKTAGAMNIGPQSHIYLPGDNQLSFPVCQFSSALVKNESGVIPEVILTNSYYASLYGDSLYLKETYADLLINNDMENKPEKLLQTLSALEARGIYCKDKSQKDDVLWFATKLFDYIPDPPQNSFGLELAKYDDSYYVEKYYCDHPEKTYQKYDDFLSLTRFHDIGHYDLYGVYQESNKKDAFHFSLCSADYETKKSNFVHSEIQVFLDGELLTDFDMDVDNYDITDNFNSHIDQPCVGWSIGYKNLIPGHHQILIVIQVEEPVIFNDSYFEPGKYEFDLHLLVQSNDKE